MTDTFRALCAELADELQEYIDYAPVGPCDEEQALVDRARTALAEPEPGCQTLADLVWSDTTTIAPSSVSINGRIYRLIPMDEPEPPAS